MERPRLSFALLAGIAIAARAQQRLIIQDSFIAPHEAAAVTAQIPEGGGCFCEDVDLPPSLFQRIQAAMAPTAPPAAAAAVANVNATTTCGATTVAPGLREQGGVGLHQDHADGGCGPAVEATVGVLYLGGDRQMEFVHTATGNATAVDVKPGRFLAWDNAAYTHRIVAGAAPRTMVGPMTVNKDGAFELVAWNPLQQVGGQLALNSLHAKPGGVVTGRVKIIVDQWNALDNLVITYDFTPPGAVSFVSAGLSPPGMGRPKPQPVQLAGGGVTFTLAGSQVPLKKEITATFKYRVASSMRSGDRITFHVNAGGTPQGLDDEVPMLVK